MLQRIQSVFLLLAALGFASLLKLPFATSTTAEMPYFDDKTFSTTDHSVMLGIAIIGILLSIFAIFKYNNRLLQMRLGIAGIILAFFMALLAVWLIYSNSNEWSESLEINYGPGIYISIAILVFYGLANRFIGKDEKKVRSMDRLR